MFVVCRKCCTHVHDCVVAMSEYIIEWSGIGARIVELLKSGTPPCLIAKRLREERRREEIVRCRDCFHAIDNGVEGNADYCGRPDGDGGYLLFGVEPDGFCKWGERSES